MKRILVLLLPIIILNGCQNKKSFTIKGIIKEKTKDYIYLNRVNVNTLVFTDSARVGKSGAFSFRVRESEPDFYQVGFSESDFITVLAEPGEKIKLEFNGKNLYQDYTVSGSEGSEQIRMLDAQLADTKRKLDSLKTIYNAASKEPGFDEKGPLIETEFDSLLKEIRKKNIEFIATHGRYFVKALYQRIDENTYVLYEPRDLQYLKIISDTLGRYYPNSKHVQALAEDLKKEMNQLYSRQIEDLAGSLPEIKLDPNLKDINGKRIALSSLRGKIVLLTFWSVQSKDCITENLQLKEIYKTYNKKGFEITRSISMRMRSMEKEVKFDELPG
jgi:hypothetical protein